jgi:hypothetical protein
VESENAAPSEIPPAAVEEKEVANATETIVQLWTCLQNMFFFGLHSAFLTAPPTDMCCSARALSEAVGLHCRRAAVLVVADAEKARDVPRSQGP